MCVCGLIQGNYMGYGQFLTGYRKVGPGGAVLLERERLLNGQNAMKVTIHSF